MPTFNAFNHFNLLLSIVIASVRGRRKLCCFPVYVYRGCSQKEMTSEKETEGEKRYRELVDKARVLENRLEMLLQVPQPVLDADHDSCFVEAHKQLTAERKPAPFFQPLLRARLVQSLKNEKDSLKRLVADFSGQLAAARREITDWEARDEPASAPSDYATAVKLVKRRRQQLSQYLDSHYPHPTDQAKGPHGVPTAPGASGHATASTSCLTIDETLDRLLTASLSETPEARYVKLGPEFWPPHVQVLLRSGVAEQHPKRSDCVKLSDWQ